MFSGLKKVFLACVVSFVACFVFFWLIGLEGNVAYANTCTSQATGSWGTAGTWTDCGGVAPQVGDNVVIANTHNVTIVTESINTVTDITIQSGGTLTQNNTNTQTILGTLTIASSGTLTHGNNSTTHAYELDFTAANIDVQGTITASRLGYDGGHRPEHADGYGPDGFSGEGTYISSRAGGGGAHYGVGGTGALSTPGGVAYDSATNPVHFGSGGGAADDSGDDRANGGHGGGLIILNVSDTLTVDGTIVADGRSPWHYVDGGGGGGGGAIKVITSIITGSGSLSANGGNGSDAGGDDAGGGGGGIIYIGYNSTPGMPSTTVTGGTSYFASGAGGAGIFTAEQLNSAPEVTTAPVFSSQATDGTGYVTLTMIVDDADDDDLSFKVEYSDDAGSTWYDPILVDPVTDTSGDGDPTLDNDAATYQVTGVKTSDGANTLTIVWDTQSASNGNGALATVAIEEDVQFRITPHDGTVEGSVGGSASFSVDNVDPVGLANFAVDSQDSTSVTFSWTAVTSETNWDHYELWYSTAPGVSIGTITEWDDSDDVDLATMATAATTITDLNTLANNYYFKIWGFDSFGNFVSQDEQWTAETPGVPTVDGATASTLDVTLDYNGNPAGATFAIEETGGGNYVQAGFGLGGPAVYQSEATWEATVIVTGLSSNTLYSFAVGARNDTLIGAGFGTAAPAYTLANPPASATASISGETATISWGANGNPSATQYYVTRSDGSVISNWSIATSATDRSMTCGGTYTYTIKARNGASVPVETAVVTTGSITRICDSVIAGGNRNRGGGSRGGGGGSEGEGEGEDEGDDEGDDEEGEEEDSRDSGDDDEVADDREEYDREDESVPEDLSEVVDSPVVEIVNVERRPLYIAPEPEYIAPEPFEISLDNERAERQRFLESFDDYADRVESYNDEVRQYFEVDSDFDGDGISNVDEVEAGLNPASVDSDGDGVSDGAERSYGSDPLDSISVADQFVDVDGSIDSDGDGISDLVELMIGSNPEDSDDGASDQFFGIQDDDDTPTLTVGTLRNIASSGGLPVFSGKSRSKPNGEVAITVKDVDGAVIKTMTVKTDAEGKFVAAPLLALADAGVKEGDNVFVQVDGSKTFMLNIGKEIAAPEIEVSGAGIEVLDNVDVDEFDYEVALPDQWYKVTVSDKSLLYIKGTKHEGRFVAALKGLRNQSEDMKIFAGTANPKTRIVFFFESLITTSVVITDLDGQFEVSAPLALGEGPHKFIGVEANLKNGTVSAPVRGILTMVRPNKILNEMLAKFAIR